MTLYEIRKALYEARLMQEKADEATAQAARLIQGRLRHADTHTLKELKRELRDFNIHTGEWKPLGGKEGS